MSGFLLDINVLIALADSDHHAHGRIHQWFDADERHGWATCAITENGFVRIVTEPRYRSPITIADAFGHLTAACSSEHHTFWPCDVSLRTIETRLLGPSQITDVYVLALAIAHGGRFVTLDRNVVLSALAGATEDHLVVL